MTATPVRLTSADPADRSRVVVEWILSSVCDFSCHYCPRYLHDGRVRWPDYEHISRFCHVVRSHYDKQPVSFLLSGGEITLYPHLPRMAGELRATGIDVVILSNGNRPTSWWREKGMLFDEVLLSYHHEAADPDQFLEVVRILETLSRVQVNIVIDPAAFDTTMAVAQRIEDQTGVPAHRKIMFLDGWKRPAEYTAQQHELLTAALAGEAERSVQHQQVSLLKGDMQVDFLDAEPVRRTPTQIIDAGWNQWRDWTCAVGVETLFVRFDEIWRASCREGGRIGSIFDEQLDLPRTSIQCSAKTCNCIAGIKASKSSPLIRLS